MEQVLQAWGPVAGIIVGLLYFERRLARVEAHIETLLNLTGRKVADNE